MNKVNMNEEYFEYLDALRDSGVTNMFGAGAYLENRFDLTRYEAKYVLMEWMKSFNEPRSPVAQ
jgi:hypothetical protein